MADVFKLLSRNIVFNEIEVTSTLEARVEYKGSVYDVLIGGILSDDLTEVAMNTAIYDSALNQYKQQEAQAKLRLELTAIANKLNALPLSDIVSPELSVTPKTLDFGVDTDQLTVSVSNTGSLPLNWVINPSHTWVICDPASGTDDVDVAVKVDRSLPEKGLNSSQLVIEAGEDSVTVDITVTIPPDDVTPTVE